MLRSHFPVQMNSTYIEEVQDFVCEVASCLYKDCLFLTDNQPEINSRHGKDQ